MSNIKPAGHIRPAILFPRSAKLFRESGEILGPILSVTFHTKVAILGRDYIVTIWNKSVTLTPNSEKAIKYTLRSGFSGDRYQEIAIPKGENVVQHRCMPVYNQNCDFMIMNTCNSEVCVFSYISCIPHYTHTPENAASRLKQR